MLSHRHLRRMHAAGRESLLTLRRHIACGVEADHALRVQLMSLARSHDAIALLTPDQLTDSSIDWECAGMVLNHAWFRAAGHLKQTNDLEAASKMFTASVGRLLKPRMPW